MAKTATTELATQDDQRAVTEYREPPAGLSGEFDQSDIVLPVCSLTQPMSKDKGQEGHFWFPDGTALDKMEVAVLDIIATRGLWATVESGLGLLCKSIDRMSGTAARPDLVLNDPDQGTDQMAIICSQCPHYEDDKNWVKGGCRFGYTLLCWDVSRETPFLYFVKGTGVKPVKQRIVSPVLIRYRQTGIAEPWRTVFSFEPQKVQDAKYKYYVPAIAPVYEADDEARAIYAEKSAELRSRAARQSYEDEQVDDDAEQASFA